jgi:hypothetical protein
MLRFAVCYLLASLVTLAHLLSARAEPPRTKIEPGSQQKQSRTDLYGDPLPEGAIARLGTVRWRHELQQRLPQSACLPTRQGSCPACCKAAASQRTK